MSDSRTSELLHNLLNERGIEYETGYLYTTWRVGEKLYVATDNQNGSLIVGSLTPEQAIAATLGSGTLTADDVLNAVYNHGARWQAIADELNELESGTCEPIVESWESDKTKYDAYCGNCKYPLGDGKLMPWNFCPNCGKRIRKAEER